jgi:hypothetical protein
LAPVDGRSGRAGGNAQEAPMTRPDEPVRSEHDAVLDEHRELRAFTEEMREARSRDALLQHLEGLHQRTMKHFAREEAPDGFYATVLEKSPRQASALAALKQEHTAFLQDVERLIGRVRTHAPKAPLDELVAAANVLADRLQQHESQENEILLEVMNTDLGTGD